MKRSDLYKKIRDIAKAQMPYLQYIDLQKKQMSRPVENYPVPLPALLVEFKETDFTNVLKEDQLGNMTISFYLYVLNVTDSFDGAESENDSLALLDKLDDVFQSFQGVSCDLFSKLIRIKEEISEYGQNYICFRTDFTTNVKDLKVRHVETVAKSTVKIQITQFDVEAI